MTPEYLVEETRDLIQDTLKEEISQALAAIRGGRDKSVTTEPPRAWFIYEGAAVLQCPAVFTVVDDASFEDQDGQNFVSMAVRMNVAVVVEDREADKLTRKAERYQAAVFRVLNKRHLQSPNGAVKLYARIARATFSPVYTKKNNSGEGGLFRKEVVLELEVKHFENPS